jgi:cold shock protein
LALQGPDASQSSRLIQFLGGHPGLAASSIARWRRPVQGLSRQNILGGKRAMPQQGTIKFFNAERGYGFIKPDGGGRDIFVHITAVAQAGLETLNEGQRVSYEIEPDKKGKGSKAVDVRLAESRI